MANLVKLQCPACGAPLKRRGITTYKCNFCLMKYKLNADSIAPEDNNLYLKQRDTVSNIKNGAYSNKGGTDEELNYNRTIVICVTVTLVLFVGMIVAAISLGKSNSGNNNNIFPTTATSKKENDTQTLKSDYFKQFVSSVFEKDYSQVTLDELTEITCIDMLDSLTHVAYRRNDGELQYVDMANVMEINYLDLKLFTGLKSLALKNEGKLYEILPVLENLEELKSRKSPKVLLKYIKYPEKMKSLECYVDDEDMGEINKFSNLERLKLDIYISSFKNKEKPDLSGIGSLTKLEDLWIKAGEYTVFPFISSLKNLKSINLHCKNLRDISFLEHTKKLESLTLVDADILNLDDLKYVPNLKVLRLNDCNEVKDFSIVASLTELEELMLSYYHKQQLPKDFECLKKVTTLTLDGFNDISFISQFPNVKKLELYGCNYSQLPNVVCMNDLEELKIGAGTNLSDFECLTGLEKLKNVKIYNTRLYADSEQLFRIPNIKELDLSNTELCIDFNGIAENTSIEKINLDNINWSCFNDERYTENRKYIYENWQVPDMNTCIDFLQSFPNLKYLSVEGNRLQSIAFLENMQKLEFLNITNNYVADIQPLNNLKNLKKVLCGENPLDSKLKLEDRIEVDFESKATFYSPFSNYEF